MATETINLDVSTARVFTALQPVTNAEDWILVINLFDGGAAYDLDGETASMVVNNPSGGQVLTATGVASDDADTVTSILTFTIRASSMAALPRSTYTVSVKLTESPATRQILLARLPVRDGGFT